MKNFFKLIFILILSFTLSNSFADKQENIKNLKLNWTDIIVISDKRDKDNSIEQIIEQLRILSALEDSNIYKYDFSDYKVREYLEENNIKYLPAILFNSNEIDININQFLQKLPDDNKYSLNIWANFDPFEEMSYRWFKIVEDFKLKKIKENSHINWDNNAQITWLVYSDLECPYCSKLHNNWTSKYIKEKYGSKVNMIFNHFPLDFHKNAFPAAQILECSFEQKGTEIFYKLINTSFENTNSSSDFIIKKSVELWINKEKLETCIESWKYDQKIKDQMNYWTETFWVTWTPWNVIINNVTWEYKIISWAYPTEKFVEVINSLLIKNINIVKLQKKYKNNDKISKIFNKIDNIVWKLNINQLNLVSKKLNKIELKIKNKTDKKSLLMKDVILYIKENVNKSKNNIK